MKNTILVLFFLVSIIEGIAQERGYYDVETEDFFRLKDFNGIQFIYRAIICAAIILFGYWLQAKYPNKILNGTGKVIIGIGGLLSIYFLAIPIFSAFLIIWQVLFGAAIFGYGVYYGIRMIDKGDI